MTQLGFCCAARIQDLQKSPWWMSCVQQVGSTPQRKEKYNENTFATSSKNLSSQLPKELHNINAKNMSE